MNTVSTTKISIPNRPAPTPPNTTSPSWMLTIGTIPPSGVKLSCHELTAPHDVLVVTVANNAELTTPNRSSLPSMLPGEVATARPCITGFGCASAQYVVATPARNSTDIAANSTQP